MKTILIEFVLFQKLHPQAGLMLVLLGKSAAMMLAAWAVAGMLRSRSARSRNWIWRAALLGLLGLLIWPLVPDRAEKFAYHSLPPTSGLPLAAAVPPEPAVEENGRMSVQESARLSPAGGETFLPWVWGAGAAGLILLNFMRRMAATVWLRRHSREVKAGPEEKRLLPETLSLRRVKDINSPMLAGLFRATIYLPEAAATWTEAKREAVLRHELAHYFRGDLWWQEAGRLICCLWWWNPVAWACWGKMKAEAEQAADDCVVLQRGEAGEYARILVEIAAGEGKAVAAGLSMRGVSSLEDRLRSIVASNPFRGNIGLAGSSLLLLFCAFVFVCLGSGVALAEADLTNKEGVIVHYQADPANNQLPQGNFKKSAGAPDSWSGSRDKLSFPENGVLRLKAGGKDSVLRTVLPVKPDWKWLTVSARLRPVPGTVFSEGQTAGIFFLPESGDGKASGEGAVIKENSRDGSDYKNWSGMIRTIAVPEGTTQLAVEIRVSEGEGQVECSGVDVIPSRAEAELDHRLVDRFYDALRANDIEQAKKMLKEEPRLVESRRGSADNGTPLIFCAWHEKPEMAQVLVDHGAQLEAIDYGAWRSTALMWCGWWGSAKTAKVLLDAGAKVAAKSAHGVTPLSSAKSGKGGNKASKATPEDYDQTIALLQGGN